MGTVNAGMFTSTTDDWPTPADLFEALDREFRFTLDPCASPANAKCENFYTVDDNGLDQEWEGSVFMNPPYGREISKWIAKAHEASKAGATVVCLIPARTDTAYWHDHVMKASEVRFVRSRLHFDNPSHQERKANGQATAHNAPFPSAVIVFKGENAGFPLMTAIARNGEPL
jgi:site-specific DNA-methyltransferase (adenine-specific)